MDYGCHLWINMNVFPGVVYSCMSHNVMITIDVSLHDCGNLLSTIRLWSHCHGFFIPIDG